MKLNKVTTFKMFFCLLFLSIFITSCEPEALPSDNHQNPVKVLSDTGDQKDLPPTRD